MAGGTTIVDRLNKLSGKDATTIAKALENLEEGGGIGGFEIHICTSAEYDSSTLVPTVTNPDASTLYLVPTSSKSKNMFDEYVWTGTDWEKFGTGSVALPSPTTADNGKVLGVDGGEYKLVEQSGGGTVEVEYIKIATATLYAGTIDSATGLFASTGGAFDGNKTLGDAVSNKKIVGFHFVPTKNNVPTFGTLSASNASQELFDVIKNADEAYQLTGYNIGLCQPRKMWVSNDTIDIYAICI